MYFVLEQGKFLYVFVNINSSILKTYICYIYYIVDIIIVINNIIIIIIIILRRCCEASKIK